MLLKFFIYRHYCYWYDSVIITAGIDLSVGSVMGLSGIATGLTLSSIMESIRIAAGLLTALAYGLVNGFLKNVFVTFCCNSRNAKYLSKFGLVILTTKCFMSLGLMKTYL